MDKDDSLTFSKIGSVTLVAYETVNFPLRSGNCFSVLASDGNAYKIVNFCYENMKEAINRGVTLPIKIKKLSDIIAVVHDSRIPDDWYFNRFCKSCCPDELLPITQQFELERQIERGQVKLLRDGLTVYTPDRAAKL